MKRVLLIFGVFLTQIVFAQEICDNSVDDDGDGLVDLNDVADCACTSSIAVPNSSIPNSSFEAYTVCPSGPSELSFANSWQQASDATSDFFHQCGYNFHTGITDDPSPYPDGTGCAGFIDGNFSYGVYKEYLGSCVSSTLQSGVTYTLQVRIFTSVIDYAGHCNSTDLDLTIFGTTNCANFPIINTGYECPTSLNSNWINLGTTKVNFISSTWQTVTITFTPTSNIEAIIIGPGCNTVNASCTGNPSGEYANFFYVDQLVLANAANFNNVGITQTGLYCSNNIEINAQASTSFVNPTYQWYKDGVAIVGATNASYQVPVGSTGLGNYQVRVIDGVDCYLSAEHEVKEEILNFSTQVTNVTCHGGSNGQVIITPNNGTSPYSYTVNGQILAGNILDNLTAGNYTVVVEDALACSSTSNITVTSPAALSVNAADVCLDLGSGNVSAQASGGTAPYQFLWNGVVGLNLQPVNIAQDAVYTVQAQDAHGCLSSVEQIQMSYVPAIDFTVLDQQVCPNEEVVLTYLINNQLTYNGLQSASWQLGELLESSITNPYAQAFDQEGLIDVTLSVVFNNGCVKELQRQDWIEVYPLPVALFEAQSQPTNILNSEVHFLNHSIGHHQSAWTVDGGLWSTAENTQYMFNDQAGGRYEVCLDVQSVYGCKSVQCQEIIIDDHLLLYIPNSFTPDGDGLNDFFKVESATVDIQTFELVLLNRWGQNIKTLTHIADSWNGTVDGKESPIGVYTYLLKGTFADQRPFERHGSVTLVR